MTSKEADPFAGFVSEGYEHGVLVKEPSADSKGADGDGKDVAKDGAAEAPAGDEPAKKPAKVQAEEAEEEVADADAESAEAEEDDAVDEDKAPAKPAKKSAGERINELTRARREAERERDAARAELAASRKAPAQAEEEELTEEKKPIKQVSKDKRPDPTKYEYGELDQKYLDDVVDYKVNQALSADKAQRETARQQEAATARQSELKGRYDDQMSKGAELFDDWETTVIEGLIQKEVPVSTDLVELILEADPEVGAKITYHLATHPKEVRQIASESPLRQAAYFGRLEAKYSAKAAPEKSNAKAPELDPPIKQPRGAGGKFGFDPATSDFSEFEAGAKKALKQG